MSITFGANNSMSVHKFTATDMNAVRNASDRDHIGNIASRVWDKIVDFFTHSDREVAKKMVFDFMDPSISNKEKIQIFDKLKEMAGENNKRDFSVTTTSEIFGGGTGKKTTYDFPGAKLEMCTMDADQKAVHPAANKMLADIHKKPADGYEMGHQFKADLHRMKPGNFTVEQYDRTHSIKTPDDLYKLLQDNLMTESDLMAIMGLCNQELLALGSTPEYMHGNAFVCPTNDSDMSYHVKLIDHGHILIKAHCDKDIASAKSTPGMIENAIDSLQSQDQSYPFNRKSHTIDAVLNVFTHKDILSVDTIELGVGWSDTVMTDTGD